MNLIPLSLAIAVSCKPDTPLSDNVPRAHTSNDLADTHGVNSCLASKIAHRKTVWLSLGLNRTASSQPDKTSVVDED